MTLNESGPTKQKLQRRDKSEMQAFREAIFAIVDEHKPCSCRQVYYVGAGGPGRLWDKDQGGSRTNYKRVVRELGVMRENGMIPYGWITDSTRHRSIPLMFDSWRECARRAAEDYLRNPWTTQPRHVEVWVESDSVHGIVYPVTYDLRVGLFSCRGQASITFAHTWAQKYRQIGKPVSVLYVGDWDPTGLLIPGSLEARLRRYSGSAVPIDFRRLAVAAEDVRTLDLLTHEVNKGDRSALKRFEEVCALEGLDPEVAVEVEAIPPRLLRDRLTLAISDLVEDVDTWDAVLDAEEAEREQILTMLSR